MAVRRKAPQHHLLRILHLLRITITPFKRNLTVSIGVDQDVERAVAVQHGEESDRSRDLAEEGLDFLLDFCFGFLSGCV